MTLRLIQWIADSGLLVGLTTIGEFDPSPVLMPLALPIGLTLTVPASGAILGASVGSAITAVGLPQGLTINSAPGWAYDGTGVAGDYTVVLTETLSGSTNSPSMTTVVVAIAAATTTLDFSLSADSGLIAVIRSF